MVLVALYLACFFISLQSLYFYSLSAPLYSVLGVLWLFGIALLSLLRHPNLTIQRQFAYIAFSPLIFLFVAILSYFLRMDAEFNRILSFSIITLLTLSYAMLARKIDPLKIVSLLIVLHSSVFFLQFVLFYAFGVDFDPLDLLSEVSQRGWGGSLNHAALGGFRRLGGLYSEPGTYGTFVGPLVALLFAFGDKSKGQGYIIGLGLVSLVLTFSIFSWIFAAIIASFQFLTSFKRFFIILAAIPGAVWLALPYIRYRFLSYNSNPDFSGVSFREEIAASVLDFIISGVGEMLFGSGLLTSEVPFEFSGAINDAGLVFFMLYSSGVVGTLILLHLIYVVTRNLGYKGATVALILLISKISIFAPMFWLIIALALHLGLIKRRSFASDRWGWRDHEDKRPSFSRLRQA